VRVTVFLRRLLTAVGLEVSSLETQLTEITKEREEVQGYNELVHQQKKHYEEENTVLKDELRRVTIFLYCARVLIRC